MLFLADSPGVMNTIGEQSWQWWFGASAGILIVSGSFIMKWLISQNAAERAATAVIVKDLIDYVKADHSRAIIALETNAQALKDFSGAVRSITSGQVSYPPNHQVP